MTREQPMPELLAPAGGEQAFYAALAGGADAIYLGGRSFNARAYADNFDTETLSRCLAIAHARGVKVYVTVNTLLTDRELPEAVSYAEELYRMGVDALIVADVGLISLLRQRLPAFPIHASTQLSLHSSRGVKELSDLAPSPPQITDFTLLNFPVSSLIMLISSARATTIIDEMLSACSNALML